MSIFDKVVAAVTPEPSAQERAEARTRAASMGARAPWLAMALDHHVQIEKAFDATRAAGTAEEQRRAQKHLATLLVGHSIAEEVVLYPSMALGDQKGRSTAAYTEQSAAKVQTAALEMLEPLTEEFRDKLEHLRAAVAHHIYEEESTWFPALADEGDASVQQRLSGRFAEEFERYMGSKAGMA